MNHMNKQSRTLSKRYLLKSIASYCKIPALKKWLNYTIELLIKKNYKIILCTISLIFFSQASATAGSISKCDINYLGAKRIYVRDCSKAPSPCQFGPKKGWQYKYYSSCEKGKCHLCVPSMESHDMCVLSEHLCYGYPKR